MQPAEKLQLLSGERNIASMLEESQLATIANDVILEYEIDKASLSEWETRMKAAIKLANMLVDAKNYPFDKAANIVYPLITQAVLQFNARAYPAIVPSDGAVKCKVFGKDPDGQKAAKAERVQDHMSYDLMCNVPEWEEDTDNLLSLLALVGTMFRKWWYDPSRRRKRCRLIRPGKLIYNVNIRSVEDAPRMTEEIELFPKEIAERKKSGEWLNKDYKLGGDMDPQKAEQFLEQHRLLDLDGDGYDEPYIVTVHKDLRIVARIVADYDQSDIKANQDGSIASVKRGTYFIAFKFMPSMDGTFPGLGLGILLGDISNSINSIINQMLDAGHMASRGGGFLGAELRIKGGKQQFSPGEWKTLNVPGAAIKEAIVPLTFPQADRTLFELLGLLVEAGKDVSSVKDILTGDSSKGNLPVGTTLALIEQGMTQFTAAYKRIFRSLRGEFRLIAQINQVTVTPQEYNAFLDCRDPNGKPMLYDPAQDYDLTNMDIIPVADPASVTKMQQMAKAQFLQEGIQNGYVDPQAGAMRMFEAASIPDPEELLPKPNPVAQAGEQAQVQLTVSQGHESEARAQLASAQAQAVGFKGQDAQIKAQTALQKMHFDGQKAQLDTALAEKQLEFETRQLQFNAMKAQMDAQSSEADAQSKKADILIQMKTASADIQKTGAEIDKIYAEIDKMQVDAEMQRRAADTADAQVKVADKVASKPVPKPVRK